MPSSFYTLYGSNLHGVKINWQNDPKLTGDRELKIAFTINMYSAKFTAGPELDKIINGVTYKKELQYVSPSWDTSDAANTLWAKNLSLLFTWKNPVTGSFPAYDGFNAQFRATIGSDMTKPDL